MDGPIVAMRDTPDGRFSVGIEPPDPLRPPETFDSKREAWGAAGGLRLVHGLRKVDCTESGQ